jgi:Mg2+ and Co2+ transporter CorA
VLVSGYAFTYAGNAGCPHFFANEKNGAHAIFRHLHVPMGLIAHVQKARLLSLAQRLSNVVSRDRTSGQLALPTQREVEDIYLQFIEFTQTAWFDEVTPQEQGQHLFSMWQRELGTAKLYEQVRQSLRDLYDYSELRSDRELNHSVAWFGLIALVLSALAVISGLFGMNEPSKEWMSLALPAEWQPRIFWSMTIFTLLGALTALIMGVRVARKNPPRWISRLSRGKR